MVKSWLKEVKPTALIKELAAIANPVITGWINYYGKFHASELWSVVNYTEAIIMKWGKKKYEKLKQGCKKANDWLKKTKERQPNLFKHWQWMRRHG